MLRFQPIIGEVRYNLRAKSGIFINPSYFDADEKTGINQSLLSNKRIQTPEWRYHNEQDAKMREIILLVDDGYKKEIEKNSKERLSNEWLEDVVHPPQETAKKNPTFEELADEYLAKKDISTKRKEIFQGLVRCVVRYAGFIRATESSRKNFAFDVDKVTPNDIEGFMDYYRNEGSLYREYPSIFAKLLALSPEVRTITNRGENTIFDRMKRLKAFFNWCNDKGKTENLPFKGVDIGSEDYADAIYLTIDERKKIANTPMPTKHLETQRDIFIFHCYVGCRPADLFTLTEANINGRILDLTPQKTVKETGAQVRIPLLDEAQQLITQYRGEDKGGRLFPFISLQRYNDAIKEILAVAGITRYVEWHNPQTSRNERRHINEIATSYIARKTFIGNLYFKVQDPNLIGKMSGHKEGSKAFSRYRKIEDETLEDAINLIK